jgi:hypothetical protein
MGRQKGVIRIKGSVSGLTFYKAYGKDLVRKTGGPSRKQILSGEKFERTRENMSEFAGCSKISKSFRKALEPLKPLTDGQFGNRLTRHFRFVTTGDDGIRGKRPIKLSTHRDEFKKFECNINCKLSSILPVPRSFEVIHNDDRTSGTVILHGGPAYLIKAPEGTTHFRLVHALGIVSDFIYNGTVKGYLPEEESLDTTGNVEYSDYFALEDEGSPEYTSTVSLSVATPLPDNVSVIHAFGITFFQQVASAYYPLRQTDALQIVEII